ncbi:lytic transglycosylase domain-containing protein [Spirobacillus cienkowskii]|uniref:lytic transglycosylase domain-containing protein n=1 Tax=Spirobacillus cienkowskii TaxID=495820 RepID=UPI0030D12554
MNNNKIKYLNLAARAKKFHFKSQCLAYVFFPIIIAPLLSGCQSSMRNNQILKIPSPTSELAIENNTKSTMQNPLLQKTEQKETDTKKTPANYENSSQFDSHESAYAPLSGEPILDEENNANTDENSLAVPDDELLDSENLVSTDSDEALSIDLPLNSIDSESAGLMDDNILLCEDNVYYKSWKEQFDSKWLAENRKKFKSTSSLQKMLNQARSNEFIKMAYPSIEKTGFDFPVVINNQVLQWINYFKNNGRKSFVVWLTRGRFIIPEMEKTLEDYGLPKDLAYLSMIESGYSPKALSYVGAVGFWQFMPATARENGLKINDYIDERRDLKKSTKAAANYLTNLYNQFGSWHLAAASYNGGPGLVRRTLRNYGSDSSFFELTSMGVVNRETADYVPKLIAAMIIAKNPEKFGFDINESNPPSATKTIEISRSIALTDLAKKLNIDKTVLEALNPELRLGITPPPAATSEGKFELEVPASQYEHAMLAINSIPAASDKYLIAARIKRRETVTAFVSRYRLNASSVLRANSHLKLNTKLRKGQVVYIPVSLGTGQYDRLTSNKFLAAKKNSKKYAAIKVAHAKNLNKKTTRVAVKTKKHNQSVALSSKKIKSDKTVHKPSSAPKQKKNIQHSYH